MPGYNTHLTWGVALGVGLGFVAKVGSHAPLSEALFGGFLCALGSILPDIDSDKSTAHKRCMTAISGSAALLLACRLRDFMLRPETVLLIGAFAYFALFYGAGTVVQKFSVHRGMFHSIPFGVICGELIFIVSSGSTQLRFFKAVCIFLGVMLHLTLDELSSARLIKTENFGTIMMMEIGAMLVGKIHNHHGRAGVERGEEKGYFKYGGSTIVLLIKNNKAVFDESLFESTDNNMETPVKMGEVIGYAK